MDMCRIFPTDICFQGVEWDKIRTLQSKMDGTRQMIRDRIDKLEADELVHTASRELNAPSAGREHRVLSGGVPGHRPPAPSAGCGANRYCIKISVLSFCVHVVNFGVLPRTCALEVARSLLKKMFFTLDCRYMQTPKHWRSLCYIEPDDACTLSILAQVFRHTERVKLKIIAECFFEFTNPEDSLSDSLC